MLFTFEERPSDSPFVERIWRAHSGLGHNEVGSSASSVNHGGDSPLAVTVVSILLTTRFSAITLPAEEPVSGFWEVATRSRV